MGLPLSHRKPPIIQYEHCVLWLAYELEIYCAVRTGFEDVIWMIESCRVSFLSHDSLMPLGMFSNQVGFWEVLMKNVKKHSGESKSNVFTFSFCNSHRKMAVLLNAASRYNLGQPGGSININNQSDPGRLEHWLKLGDLLANILKLMHYWSVKIPNITND